MFLVQVRVESIDIRYYAQQFELMDSLDYSVTGFKRNEIISTPGAKYQFLGLICANFHVVL